MSTPDIAARLLLANDEGLASEARALAQQLDGENTRRQEEEADDRRGGKEDRAERSRGRRTLGARRRGRRAGIAASSASSLRSWSTRFIGRRSCCRSRTASHMDRAAASRASTCWRRSRRARRFFIRFGGHKQAAGLTMEAARVREFRAAINDRADLLLGPEELMPRLRIDSDLRIQRYHLAGRLGNCRARAVRRGKPQAGVRRASRRGDRWTTQTEGTASEDGAPA
ncbi:MAG: hypothetical protein QM736_07960 [Vicinamibacterales bacterium]